MKPSFKTIAALLCWFALSFSGSISAQNLVLNPSFESFTACPIGTSEFSNATNWDDPLINVVTDTCSTSDLYNTCSPFGAFGVGVPANILGNEAARTGNGYAGIIVVERLALFGCNSFFGSNWREYVHGELSAPLNAGQSYCVTFYVSLADNVKYASGDLSVYLSNGPINISCAVNGTGPLPFTPQMNYGGGAITNVNGWTEIQFSYTAAGGEQYITIGNFRNDAASSFSCANSSAFNPYAYYYIDDVSVEPGICATLPVELAGFGGAAESEGNRLWWETTAERDHDHFEIEWSVEGESWQLLERVEGQGKGTGGIYEVWDRTPNPATWYRLRQVDVNGDQRILEQTMVQREAEVFLVGAIGPNPSRGQWTVDVPSHKEEMVARVVNGQGRIVREMRWPATQLRKQHTVELGDVANGMYRVHFQTGAHQEVRTILMRK